MYSGVPKNHHLNCEFSVVPTLKIELEEQIFHLLAERQEDIRYWVYGLRCVGVEAGARTRRCVGGRWKLILRTRKFNLVHAIIDSRAQILLSLLSMMQSEFVKLAIIVRCFILWCVNFNVWNSVCLQLK